MASKSIIPLAVARTCQVSRHHEHEGCEPRDSNQHSRGSILFETRIPASQTYGGSGKEIKIAPTNITSQPSSSTQTFIKREVVSPMKEAILSDRIIFPKKEVVSPKKGVPPIAMPSSVSKYKTPSISYPREMRPISPKKDMISPQNEMFAPLKAVLSHQYASENKVIRTPSKIKKSVVQRGPGKVKKLKDPHAPKRPGSTFLLFSKEERPRVVEMLKTKQPGPVGVELSKRWAALGDDERIKWDVRWKEEMAKYEEDKKNYRPSEEYLKAAAIHNEKIAMKEAEDKFVKDWDTKVQVGSYFTYLLTNWVKVALEGPQLTPKQIQDLVWLQWSSSVGNTSSELPRKKRIRTKDPNAPKHPSNAYALFTKEVRPDIAKANPGLTNTELMSKIGQMWKNLDDKAKEPYTNEARKKLDIYYEEKIKYMECKK